MLKLKSFTHKMYKMMYYMPLSDTKTNMKAFDDNIDQFLYSTKWTKDI